MLWPAVRVARALWRGVGEWVVRRREPFRVLAPRTLFPLSLTLVNRQHPSVQGLFVCHTNT